MTITIGDDPDPTSNTKCAVAKGGGAYRCNLEGSYIGFVGKNPGKFWKFQEIMAFEEFLPSDIIATSSELSTMTGNDAKNSASFSIAPRSGRYFNSALGEKSDYMWT
jgi:hypothetical protein